MSIDGYYKVILDNITPTVKELINTILKEKGDQNGIIFLTPFDDSGTFDFINGQHCLFYKGEISVSNIDETVMNYHIINAIGYFMDHLNMMVYTFEIESPNQDQKKLLEKLDEFYKSKSTFVYSGPSGTGKAFKIKEND